MLQRTVMIAGVLLSSAAAQAQLDPSFDSDGKAWATSANGFVTAEDVVMQGDKPLWMGNSVSVIAGNSMVVGRLAADGSGPDSAFNAGSSHYVGGMSGAALVKDGTAVVAGGTHDNQFALYRLKSDGTPDTSFGSDGLLRTNFGSFASESIHDLARDAEGRIVACGVSNTASRTPSVLLARYLPGGGLDPDFDSDGKVIVTMPQAASNETFAQASCGIAPGGTAIVVGATTSSGKNYVFRVKSTGILDTGFRGGIFKIGSDGGDGKITSVAVRQDGVSYLGGNTDGHVFSVFSFDKEGDPNPYFGDNGAVFTDFGSTTTDGITDLVYDAGHERLFAVGFAGNQFAYAAYFPTGKLDVSLDRDGKVITDWASAVREGIDAVTLNDERLVVVGTANMPKEGSQLLSLSGVRVGLARLVIPTAAEDEPCTLADACESGLACTRGGRGLAKFTWCRVPSAPVPPGPIGVVTPPATCEGEGMPCTVHPSDCTGNPELTVDGIFKCVNSRLVCKASANADYCSTCGGECGQCGGQPCGPDLLCAPGDICSGPPGQLECRAACTVPQGYCWTASDVGSCGGNIAIPECADIGQNCSDIPCCAGSCRLETVGGRFVDICRQ